LKGPPPELVGAETYIDLSLIARDDSWLAKHKRTAKNLTAWLC